MATKEVRVDQDPVNFLSDIEREKLGQDIAKLSASQILELKQHATILKNKYRTHAMQTNPTSTTIYENATITKIDMLNTKKAAIGQNFIARKMANEGRKEAEGILEKFSQNYYGDNILRDVEGMNPIKSVQDYLNFEEKKSIQLAQAETVAQNEEQFERLQQRVGTTTPDPSNRSILNSEDNYLRSFNSTRGVQELLKSCIPCDLRIADFTANFSAPWEGIIADMNAKWKDMLRMLRDLFTFKPGEFSMDLCNLFKFLDGQCIPDLTGLISLLSIMQLKYMDLSTTSLSNIINQLIAPFLTPVIGSFTSNLDQYIDLVVGPLKCINENLQKQIITLQDQINGVAGFRIDENYNIRGNIADQNSNRYRMQQIDFYDAKIKSLRNRLRTMENNKLERDVRQLGASRADLALDGDVLTPSPYPDMGDQVKDPTRQEKIIQTKLIAGGIRVGGTLRPDGTSSNIQRSNDSEKRQIKLEIDKMEAEKKLIRAKITLDSSYTPTNFNGAVSMTRAAEGALSNFEKSYKSLIGDLTNAINDGINIIKQSVDIYREEFQRLLLGRVTTQQDQIEFTRMLQDIARLGSIVKTVNYLNKGGNGLNSLCLNRDSGSVLGQIAQGIKENSDSDMFDFYQAMDSEGNPLIVIAPGGATVNVSSVEFNDITDDALFAEASFNLDSVTKTVSFNDLNEVDKLNREGIAPDLGDISNKQIELSNKTKIGSELDLHFKTSYAIISNEFCSKSAINFGSSDTVKKWAAGLWQKN